MNIIGRVTRDAEVRITSQQKQVVSFSIAINDNYRNKNGERIEQTSYFDCSYWINMNVAKLLTKGSLVELTGRLNLRTWKSYDGESHAGLNFHTESIKLHGSSKRAESVQTTAQTGKNSTTEKDTEDNLPF